MGVQIEPAFTGGEPSSTSRRARPASSASLAARRSGLATSPCRLYSRQTSSSGMPCAASSGRSANVQKRVPMPSLLAETSATVGAFARCRERDGHHIGGALQHGLLVGRVVRRACPRRAARPEHQRVRTLTTVHRASLGAEPGAEVLRGLAERLLVDLVRSLADEDARSRCACVVGAAPLAVATARASTPATTASMCSRRGVARVASSRRRHVSYGGRHTARSLASTSRRARSYNSSARTPVVRSGP